MPAIPSAERPGSSDDVERSTRLRGLVARPGHTLTRTIRGEGPQSGSPASTSESAAPSQPLRRRRARQQRMIAVTQAITATSEAIPIHSRGALAPARRRQPMKPSMTTTETRGAPLSRDDPVSEPGPRRSTPGHVKRIGRARTSKTSSPRRRRAPGVISRAVRVVRHQRARLRSRNGGESGWASRNARPSRVVKTACVRATLAHDRGISPARPTVPGAITTPTSGP